MQRLTPMDIYKKDFKHAIRGYDIDEVNQFLDLVIKNFEELIEENERLKKELKKAQSGQVGQMTHPRLAKTEISPNDPVIQDILRRLERLEQRIFSTRP
ncbi:DivIVA domain-containing protein [Polycladomyces sp. WAk]|uniref:DivIVA domain-containing protein n=1 Tax=Polycladomyces zharkentensis TaxID=2807616 RepID=A0ABS2WG08_9BACL|nr:DivIVA domain-containing protein [Polycladomyces sp. WAk]MBN2908485.1 DivIVA domain-containing protein [Polycladomyces sp. WAk]